MEQKKTKTQTKSEKVEEKEQEMVENLDKKEQETQEKVEISVEEMEEIMQKARKYDELIATKRVDKDRVVELVSNLRKTCYSNFTISRTQTLSLIDTLLAKLRNL